MRAGQQRAEVLGAHGDRDRQADGAPQRVAPAHPVPEAEGLCDAEGGRRGFTLVVAATKWRPMSVPPWSRNQARATCRVGHGLLRGEGLAGDDEQRVLGRSLRSTGTMSWPSTLLTKCIVMPRWAQASSAGTTICGPEVAAADADVDDMADARAAGVAHPFGEGEHPVEHAVHLVAERPRPRGARSAVCSTARPSVVLIGSPASIASRRAPGRTPASSVSSLRVNSPTGSSTGRRTRSGACRLRLRSGPGHGQRPRAGPGRGRAPRSGPAARPRRGSGRSADVHGHSPWMNRSSFMANRRQRRGCPRPAFRWPSHPR
jgi:hypothetical protein